MLLYSIHQLYGIMVIHLIHIVGRRTVQPGRVQPVPPLKKGYAQNMKEKGGDEGLKGKASNQSSYSPCLCEFKTK